MKRNRQAMPPCLSMLSQRLWKLLETTNNNSESQFVWWCCGHGDGVVRSQANPYVPLLPGSFMRPVDGNTVQLPAVPVFWWILPMNLPATISSVQCPVLSHKNVVASEASNSRLVMYYVLLICLALLWVKIYFYHLWLTNFAKTSAAE